MGPRIRSGTELVDKIWGGAGRKFGKKVENPGAMEESGIPPEIHSPTSPGVVRGDGDGDGQSQSIPRYR
jgi:hypothetical protein